VIRDWLARLHYQRTGRTSGGQAIGEAIATLGGMARYDGAEHGVSVRIAAHNGSVYLDLANPEWRVVEITAHGWRIVSDPPVRLRRTRGLLPLPTPAHGGNVDALRGLANLRTDDDWRLAIGWLLGAFRPSGPYLALALTGEQGSAKSTTARLLRRLIDPSVAELRAEPREVRDLMIAASSSWIVALDNLSHLQPWLSDSLCRLSTGGALSTRQLYTNDDEHIIEVVRPVILTSITDIAIRGDLQERSIAITLPSMPEAQRRSEADLWREYEHEAPGILGSSLDAVSCALRRERDVRLPSLSRMADWAVWVTAAEPALKWPDGAIIDAYAGSGQSAIESALDGDPLAVALRAISRPWLGTAADLLTQLAPASRAPRGWPESPRALSSALRRLAPQLRRIGIHPDLGRREAHTGRRLIVIEDSGAPPSPRSPPSPGPNSAARSGDGRRTEGDTRREPPSPELLNRSGDRNEGDTGDGGDGGDGPISTSFIERHPPMASSETLLTLRDGLVASVTAPRLLWSLEDRGFEVVPVPSGLRVQPVQSLTPEDVATIRAYRAELIALVSYCETGWSSLMVRSHSFAARMLGLPGKLTGPRLRFPQLLAEGFDFGAVAPSDGLGVCSPVDFGSEVRGWSNGAAGDAIGFFPRTRRCRAPAGGAGVGHASANARRFSRLNSCMGSSCAGARHSALAFALDSRGHRAGPSPVPGRSRRKCWRTRSGAAGGCSFAAGIAGYVRRGFTCRSRGSSLAVGGVGA
jgi:hypothetical protein